MSAIPLIIEALLKDPDVGAIVHDRIFAVQSPQGATLPAIVVVQTSEATGYTLDHRSDGYPEARINLICRADTASRAILLGDAAIKALQNLREGVSGATATFFRAPIDRTDFIDGERAFRRILGWAVRYRA